MKLLIVIIWLLLYITFFLHSNFKPIKVDTWRNYKNILDIKKVIIPKTNTNTKQNNYILHCNN